MTQTAAVASNVAGGVTAGTNGVAGMDAGGLFGLLMGFNAGQVGGDTAMPTVVATLVNDAALGGGDAAQQSFQLGDGPLVQVQGDPLDVGAYLQEVQEVYRQMVVQGGLTLGKMSDAKELAGALTKMGMEPEAATMVAQRIETMLEMVKQQQQGMDDDTAGTLATMMLAALLPQQNALAQTAADTGDDAAQAVQVQISSLTQANVAQSFKGIHLLKAAGDASMAGLTRQMAGLDRQPVADVPAEAAGDVANQVAAVTDAAKEVYGEDKAPKDGEGTAGVTHAGHASREQRELLVSVSPAPREQAGVSVQVPPHAQADVAPVAVENAALAVSGAGEKIAPEKVIEKAKGDVLYKWQADGSGNELLQAVKPHGDAQDAGLNLAAQAQQGALAGAGTADAAQDAVQSFADRLADARNVAAGQQVAVQIKPLAEHGGGAIRMTLNPPELGQVQIELNIADGKVHGTISATQSAVVEQLARDLHSLRQGLADAGLKLGDQGINLMLSNNQSGNQQQGQHQGQAAHQGQGFGGGWNGAGAAEADVADVATDAAPGVWVSPDRVVDMSV